MKYIRQQWFLLGIAAVAVLGFQFPQTGAFIKYYNVLNVGIFIAFLTTGLNLETRRIVTELRNFKTLLAATIMCFVAFPAVAFLLARLFWPNDMDMLVGACILGVAPVTVASGTILTRVAKGNVPLSLFICVATSLVSIFTIPLSLELLLESTGQIDLPVGEMFTKLLLIVLLPTLVGQLLRIRLAEAITPCRKYFSVFSKLVVLLIIVNAVANSAGRISGMGAAELALIFAFAVGLHLAMLGLNFSTSKIIGLDGPSTSTFTIHCSQKTLTVSTLVFEGFFSAAYPLAMIPIIAHHITQILADTIVAQRFRAVSDRQKPGDADTSICSK